MELILIIATLLGGVAAIWFFFDKTKETINSFFLKSKSAIPESIFDISDENFSFIDRNLETLSGSGHVPINSTDSERCIALKNLGILEKSSTGVYTIRKKAKTLLFKE